MKLIPLSDHPHNLCKSARRVSGGLERLGLYRCDHGVTAVMPYTDRRITPIAIDTTFATEDDARAALATFIDAERE
jgi:hypothetical protein